MSSNQKNMANAQYTKTANQHTNTSKLNNSTANDGSKENGNNTRNQSPAYRSKSTSPAISPKTIISTCSNNSTSSNQEKRKSGGIFGNGTFDPAVATWEAMSDSPQGTRGRGGTVMPEPESEERMKQLAKGGGGAGAARK